MALSIPDAVSVTLGVGFPGHGIFATPFVTTAPSLFRSTNSLYSVPDPNVPDAVITGFLSSTPARFTFILLIALPPCSGIQVRLYILSCYEHENEDPHLWICTHRQDTRLRHRPYALPWRSSTEFPFQAHMP